MKYKDIILRAPAPGDLDLLLKWENNREIWQVSDTRVPYTPEEIIRHIEESASTIYESGQARFIICLALDSTPVGAIDLFDFDSFHRRTGIGILIAEESNRRKGFARMAVEAIIEYCFSRLGVHQLYCNILADNPASIALFEGAGFTLSGTSKDWIRTGDDYKDELFYQLIATS